MDGPADPLEPRIRAIEDRNTIVELWERYCQLCDAQDAERLVAEVYAADAVEEYAMGHQTGRLAGRAELRDYFASGLSTCDWTAHVLGQTRVAVAGDTATGRHYITGYHWLRRPEADPMRPADWIAVGVLVDRLRRGPAGWRIVHRQPAVAGGAIAVGRPPP